MKLTELIKLKCHVINGFCSVSQRVSCSSFEIQWTFNRSCLRKHRYLHYNPQSRKIMLWNEKIILWLRITTAWGTILMCCIIKKADNHGTRGMVQQIRPLVSLMDRWARLKTTCNSDSEIVAFFWTLEFLHVLDR